MGQTLGKSEKAMSGEQRFDITTPHNTDSLFCWMDLTWGIISSKYLLLIYERKKKVKNTHKKNKQQSKEECELTLRISLEM